MPPRRYLLILTGVVCAGLITVWVGKLVANSLSFSGNSLFIALPIILLGLVLWRLIVERLK